MVCLVCGMGQQGLTIQVHSEVIRVLTVQLSAHGFVFFFSVWARLAIAAIVTQSWCWLWFTPVNLQEKTDRIRSFTTHWWCLYFHMKRRLQNVWRHLWGFSVSSFEFQSRIAWILMKNCHRASLLHFVMETSTFSKALELYFDTCTSLIIKCTTY